MFTGDARRHRFVASAFARDVKLASIVIEAKTPVVADPQLLPEADQRVVRAHFKERDIVEAKLLPDADAFPDTEVLEVPNGQINSERVAGWVRKKEPNLIFLYGTSIIKAPVLDAYAGRMINLHLGLSPYYRGSGTNFWPLVCGEPECVGSTIHLAESRVDAGAILAQVRPEPSSSDRAHELETKTIIESSRILGKSLRSLPG